MGYSLLKVLHARCILYVCQAEVRSLPAQHCSAAAAVAQPEAVVVADDAVPPRAGETSSRLVSQRAQLSAAVRACARLCWH